MNRKQCLDAALAAVYSRPDDYGPPEKNFERIAALWNVVLGPKLGEHPISAVDVAMMQIAVKLARLVENPEHDDSWVDIAGYAGCGAEIMGEPDPAAEAEYARGMMRQAISEFAEHAEYLRELEGDES